MALFTPAHELYAAGELDAQFNARATVPDVQPFLAEYAALSAAARQQLPCELGVAYGPGPDERLDLFLPARAAAPVFVFVHGGYWRLLSRNDSSFMAPVFTRAGALVVAIDYTLAPAATLAHIVAQVRRAVAWVHRNIARHGGDPARIHVAGSSAGAHLVGMLLSEAWREDHGLPRDVIRGATVVSGLFDLRSLPHTHVNDWLHLDAVAAESLSPLLHLPGPAVARGCPLVVACGETETAEFRRQSERYLRAWRAAGGHASLVPMPGTNHFDVITRLADESSPLTRAVLAQMGLGAVASAAVPQRPFPHEDPQ